MAGRKNKNNNKNNNKRQRDDIFYTPPSAKTAEKRGKINLGSQPTEFRRTNQGQSSRNYPTFDERQATVSWKGFFWCF